MKLRLPSHRPPRILITRADRIGDLVLSTPVLTAVRERYPNAYLACLTLCENGDILRGNPHLNEVILYDKKGKQRNWVGQILFGLQLRKKKFDIVIHLHATNRMHFATFVAGIPKRVGYTRKFPWALTHGCEDKKRYGTMHEAKYNFDLMEIIDVPKPETIKAFFPLQDRAIQSFEELIKHHQIPENKPWVVLHPSASCPSKKWPVERFADLIDLMATKYDVSFIIVGTAKESEEIEKIKLKTAQPVFDLCGRLTLAMLGVLLSRAALMVSNDSGPVHVANAVDTPVVSIFGRNQAGLSAERWGPLDPNSRIVWKDVGCETCLAHLCEIHFLCLDSILAEDVLKEVDCFEQALKKEGVNV